MCDSIHQLSKKGNIRKLNFQNIWNFSIKSRNVGTHTILNPENDPTKSL
ncbi:hypothetical protein LBBP_03480 [Leptospira borgpetersenii serovar Ballum]|uniref:Uncharacterized protein n=1 Tax=Leptospira borgpetersenii serovar Ballum TaxID=280505 RepID=A0A0S2IVG6_LEPBO|nr:hypothetical protein LBBP_03480 [Leptospira borgpetersenii serovar Ballum]